MLKVVPGIQFKLQLLQSAIKDDKPFEILKVKCKKPIIKMN